MSKSRPRAERPVDAVRRALERERTRRKDGLKPIEIVKAAISAYLAHEYAQEPAGTPAVCDDAASPASHESTHPLSSGAPFISEDRRSLRRGTQAAVDRLLFNANYWRSAYEDRIVAACSQPEDADACLRAVSVWSAHTLKLNTLSPDETAATFERFCPPFALNRRRGSDARSKTGKGPVPDFRKAVLDIAEHRSSSETTGLLGIVAIMEAEADTYEKLRAHGSVNALFSTLPAWCLQNRIDLVNGGWWDDCDVMELIIGSLYERFLELGFGEASCRYFLDSCQEAIDAYQRDISSEPTRFADLEIPELVTLVQEARDAHPSFETDGYGCLLPPWLISKEQIIWNVLVCALYGPASTRPLLVDSPDLLTRQGYAGATDVITELARTSFARYTADRVASQTEREYPSFAHLPADLRDSSIAYISSIHAKLETLGYEIMPAGTCYPERRVSAFTASEVECLAILEHRRWLRERARAGWSYGPDKDVDARRSPYLVPWEELPARAKEWNRSAVRSIPALLASVNLAVVR